MVLQKVGCLGLYPLRFDLSIGPGPGFAGFNDF